MTPTQWIEGLISGLDSNKSYRYREINSLDILPRLLEELKMFRNMGYGGHELGLSRDPEGYIEVIPLSMINSIRDSYVKGEDYEES